MAWRLAQCPWRDQERLNALLRDSWEPFAATETDHITTVWLRRSSDPEQARVEPTPPRMESELRAVGGAIRDGIAERLRGDRR